MERPDDPADRRSINDDLKAQWKAKTSPKERVRSVLRTVYDGLRADEIAEKALVAESTARKRLEQLIEEGYVESVSRSNSRATLYRRSPESLILEEAHVLIEEHTRQELAETVSQLERELETFRVEYGTDDPETAVLSTGALSESTGNEVLHDWQSVRRDLQFHRVALAVSIAEDDVMQSIA